MGQMIRRIGVVFLVLLATGGMVVGSIYAGREVGDYVWAYAWILWAPVGGLILFQRPGNWVGRIALGIGVSYGISFLLLAGIYGDRSLEVRAWMEMIQTVTGVLPWLGVILLLVVFPSGTFEGRPERIAGLAVAVAGAWAAVGFAASTVPMEVTGVPSPLANHSIETFTAWLAGDQGFFIVPLLTIMSIGTLFRRSRRSSGIERQQFRWLLFGALAFLAFLGFGSLIPDVTGFEFIWVVAGASIPLAIGVAVLRYRLYEIDRIISRTVSYALVVGLLGLVLFGLVAGLGTWLGRENQLVVAVSTLAVAGLFNPVRRRVQGWVDRRFNRSRYDAERVMSEFVAGLRGRVDRDGVVEGWVGVVSETMQPTSVGVWVRS
jgi:hypothetical protein